MDGWFVCGAVSVEGAKRHSSGNKSCKTEQWEELKHMTEGMFLYTVRGDSLPLTSVKNQIPGGWSLDQLTRFCIEH